MNKKCYAPQLCTGIRVVMSVLLYWEIFFPSLYNYNITVGMGQGVGRNLKIKLDFLSLKKHKKSCVKEVFL